MRTQSFYTYLHESIQDSPLKTAIINLYALLENGIPQNTMKIPSKYRQEIADKIVNAIKSNQIDTHARTGGIRYAQLGHDEFSQTHRKAEAAIKEFQEGRLDLDIVPIYYQDNCRYIACAELPDNDMIMIVTGNAEYPPDPSQQMSILTYYAGLADTRKSLLRHIIRHPDDVTDEESAMWTDWQNEHKQQMKDLPFYQKPPSKKFDPNNPYTYHQKLEPIRQKQDKIKPLITNYSQQLTELKSKIKELQTDPSQQQQLNKARSLYCQINSNYHKLEKQAKLYNSQIKLLADQYRAKFNHELTHDNGYIRLGKTLRWYEPNQLADQKPSGTCAAE